MLMPKKNRIAIYEHLFTEGVMVAEKNFVMTKHPDVDVPNLHVVKALTSLKSRGYVKEQFAWRHYYWYLTNEGIDYLRNTLHLPPEIVPTTLKRQSRPDTGRAPRSARPEGGPRAPTADRQEYRKGFGSDKEDSSFGRGGFGRGSAPKAM